LILYENHQQNIYQFFFLPHLKGRGCYKCGYNGYSKTAIDWLKYEENERGIKIQHALNGGEKRIGKYFVDGFHKESNTIFEFHGCFWHSHIENCKNKNYDKNQIHPIRKLTHEEVYVETMYREFELEQMGYNLIVMWECEWNSIDKSIR
jgi:hypothetical protein